MAQQNTPEQKKPEVKVGEENKVKRVWKFMTFMMGGFICSYCRCCDDDCHFVTI